MADAAAESLTIRVERGGLPESSHKVAVAITRGGRLERSLGAVDAPVFPRSAAKPIQAIPLVLSGAADAYSLDSSEIAIACASHSGTPEHCQVVESMLKKADLGPESLQCGVHPPFDRKTAEDRIRDGAPPGVLHNNCSGKHAGMLLVARHRGEPLESYRDSSHPVQGFIRDTLARLVDCSQDEIQEGEDGCGVPAHALPLWRLALAYERLANPGSLDTDLQAAVRRIVLAIQDHPFLFGGPEQLSTRILEVAGDRMIGKGGAEGVFALGVLGGGPGIGIKCEDGSHRGSRAALLHILQEMDLVSPAEAETLRPLAAPPPRSFHGAAVGRIGIDETARPRGDEG